MALRGQSPEGDGESRVMGSHVELGQIRSLPQEMENLERILNRGQRLKG